MSEVAGTEQEQKQTAQVAKAKEDDPESDDTSSDDSSTDGSDGDEPMDEDEDDEDDGGEARQIKKYLELLGKIQEDKYNYNHYTELLDLAHEMIDLDKIRQSAEIFAEVYPLAPEIWLRWLRVELQLATTLEQLRQVDQLFRRALKDYYSVDVALEYADLARQAGKTAEGTELAETIWDILIPTYGLHTTKGRAVFEVYREDVLARNGDSEDALNQVARIYEQELKIPLVDMERSCVEYKLLCEKHKDVLRELNVEKFERRYKQAKELLESGLLPFEERLKALDPLHHQERAELYREYIQTVGNQLGDDELQVLYERCVTDCCLDPTVWCDYLGYLRRYPPLADDGDGSSASPVFSQTCEQLVNRALRNCPWSAELYVEKMRILERERRPKADVLRVMEDVATVEFQTPEAAVKVWLEYLTYLRRQANFDEEKEREILRSNFELAWSQLGRTWGDLADPKCKILQFWGRLEYGPLGNAMKGRDLWHSVMDSSDNSTRAGLWIEFAELEATRGLEAVRKLYRKAIEAVGLNDPETLASAWLRFERCNGTLEQLTSCQEICNATILAYYKSLASQQQRHKQGGGRKSDTKRDNQQQHESPGPSGEGKAKKTPKRKHDNQSDGGGGTGEGKDRQEVFKKPAAPPELNLPGPSSSNAKRSANNSAESVVASTKRMRLAADEPKESVAPSGLEGDKPPENDNRRVFFSNLSFDVTEEQLKANFPELAIKSIELVYGSNGKSRGFGYVELESEEEVKQALSLDRKPLDGRPVFISSLARDKTARQKRKFKYAETLEPNKLFIKGLPFEAKEADIGALFERFGKIKDIRLVCFRSGKSKGLAYVEFETEAAAKNAVLQMDQHVMNGFTISVALSAPPPRANPTATTTISASQSEAGGESEAASTSVSLGSGKRHVAKGDVKQKLSAMIPMAVLRRGGPAAAGAASSSSQPENKPKSNEDFRKLLLK